MNKKKPHLHEPTLSHEFILFFGNSEKDRKICQMIMERHIPCRFIATTEGDTPKLWYGLHEIESDRIERFLENL